MGSFRDLKVWHQAMGLAELVYAETKRFPPEERYGLVSQMRRAAVSVPSNLAEGEGRVGRDGRHFLDIAYGSILELETQIELSLRLGYIGDAAHRSLIDATSKTARMLNGLKSARDRILKPDTRNPKPETRNLTMDKEIRKNIQDATQAGRTLLERAFREQLEGTYDILLDGTIAEQPGSHLSERKKVTREKLVAAVVHKRSTGLKAKEAVDAYLREAAFTTLNRFVALKMLEARQLVQECISKGEDSSGFKEFTALAPGLVAVEDKGYRLYIETLFDEIGQEVKVLFDRRDVVSLLWPDRQTLLQLLEILNDPELGGGQGSGVRDQWSGTKNPDTRNLKPNIWKEDETIGWVYQYFNGDDERTQMRAESQAPRNSRELAVRNQFFTPRYVVQFLTDNTLGRTWYEMMRGETRLANLDYLVRRPNEVFLDQVLGVRCQGSGGESSTLTPETRDLTPDLSQEELLQQTVYVPFRAKKDPRELRILDPACGSGHFLLYAFELLVSVYEEAWGVGGAAAFTETGTQLQADYGSIKELRRAIPELILRYNLHGVDIDPRAAQIAALALWMRAQRGYNQFDVNRAHRPPITKTNIVVAEPMPGDAELVEEFAASLKPVVLGDLFKKMVDEMKLAGELGSLLKIEESIAKAVREAEEAHRQGDLFAGNVESQDFWDTADEKIIAALAGFAESAAGSAGIRRQLFAGDAAQGVAFIELMRKRFDVVLMNPPFGAPIQRNNADLGVSYPSSRRNLAAVFIDAARNKLSKNGCIGIISDKVIFFKSAYENFRQSILLSHFTVGPFLALGWEVLDANVEVVASVLDTAKSNKARRLFVDVTAVPNKALNAMRLASGRDAQDSKCSSSWNATADFAHLPSSAVAYNMPEQVRTVFRTSDSLIDLGAKALQGHNLSMLKFGRFWWEMPSDSLETNRVVRMYKGGPYCRYYQPSYEVAIWMGDGSHLRDDSGTRWSNARYQTQHGIGYGKRGDFLDAHIMHTGHIFTVEGLAVFPPYELSMWGLLGYLNSSVTSYLLSFYSGQHKEAGYLQLLPVPSIDRLEEEGYVGAVRDVFYAKQQLDRINELSPLFLGPFLYGKLSISLNAASVELTKEVERIGKLEDKLDGLGYKLIGLDEAEARRHAFMSSQPQDVASIVFESSNFEAIRHFLANSWLSFLAGCTFGRWNAAYVGELEQIPENLKPTSPLPYSPAISAGSWGESNGILVDDNGSGSDLELAIRETIKAIWGSSGGDIELELIGAFNLGSDGIRVYLSRNFFSWHLSRYKKGQGQAPIYWQLATPSASYSVWCYYHRLTRDTFFRVANDYVTPKVDHEERKLNELRQEAGPDPSSKQRKAIDAQETFVAELSAFKTEVTRIAPLWNPNLNDGVIINFAPLWRLVPQHKAWQKECKKVWDKLVKGDYDWAHIAMHLWSERVVPKCQDDRSLAIAHGLEGDFWYEDDNGKWRKRQVSDERIEEFVAERDSTAVKTALKDLLEAPAPAGQARRKRRAKA